MASSIPAQNPAETARALPTLDSTLREAVGSCYIVAYKENTQRLENALVEDGFKVETLRVDYTPVELTYSRTIRCLLNHASAWEKASRQTSYSIVVEADFVPCVGFGAMPLPFDASVHGDKAWAFLYSGGPRFFELLADRTTPGHSSCPVAIIISPQVAALLVEYCKEELLRHGDLTQYSLWDAAFQWHIMGKGGRCFMAYRQYGEHGGIANREHKKAGTGFLVNLPMMFNLGIGVNHHADTLRSPLKFLPDYARGSRFRFLRIRFEAKALGFARLFTGRTISIVSPMSFSAKLRLFWYSFWRLVNL